MHHKDETKSEVGKENSVEKICKREAFQNLQKQTVKNNGRRDLLQFAPLYLEACHPFSTSLFAYLTYLGLKGRGKKILAAAASFSFSLTVCFGLFGIIYTHTNTHSLRKGCARSCIWPINHQKGEIKATRQTLQLVRLQEQPVFQTGRDCLFPVAGKLRLSKLSVFFSPEKRSGIP